MGLFKSASKLGAFAILTASILMGLRTPEEALAFLQLGSVVFIFLVVPKTAAEAAKTIFKKGQE